MDFSEALKLLKQGQCLRRPYWGNCMIRINYVGHDSTFTFYYNDRKTSEPWSIHETDILAVDWVTYD